MLNHDYQKTYWLICITLVALPVFSQKTFIWCGVLIDGISNEPKKNMTIVLRLSMER